MGIVERKLREKEQRMQEILQASRFLFRTKGYVNTTMLDIAERSELSRRTIYLYFKSKEEISYRVMNDAYEMLHGYIHDAAEKTCGDGYEKLKAIRSAYMEFYRTHFDQLSFTLYFDIKMNDRDMDDEEARSCFLVIQKIISELVSALKKGCEDGSIRPLGSVEKTALTAINMIQSTMQKVAVRQDWIRKQYSLEGSDIIEEMFDLLFSSIRNPARD